MFMNKSYVTTNLYVFLHSVNMGNYNDYHKRINHNSYGMVQSFASMNVNTSYTSTDDLNTEHV